MVKIKKLTTEKELNELVNEQALTIIGLLFENESEAEELEDLFKNVFEFPKEKDFELAMFTGKLMNEVYGLTEKNAYANDLSFVSVRGYSNIAACIAITPALNDGMGCFLFNHIVEINAIKQKAINERYNRNEVA